MDEVESSERVIRPDSVVVVVPRNGGTRLLGPTVRPGQYVRVNLTRQLEIPEHLLARIRRRVAPAHAVDVVGADPALRSVVAHHLWVHGTPVVTVAPDVRHAAYGTGPPAALDERERSRA
jgi:hypothetical protein